MPQSPSPDGCIWLEQKPLYDTGLGGGPGGSGGGPSEISEFARDFVVFLLVLAALALGPSWLRMRQRGPAASSSAAVRGAVIAATNRDLDEAVREGRFRQDLYYRLNVFPITLPPLRERREDIPALVSALVGEFGTALGKNIESISRESMDELQRYHWPGNVRELRNVIERAMIVAKGPKLWIRPPGKAVASLTPLLTMEEVEREHIRRVLEMTGWRVRGRNGAAEMLGIKPTTLESRMARLGISRGAEDRTK